MKEQNQKVLVSLPAPLLKKLDLSARRESRNRSSEICVLLEVSLKLKRAKDKAKAAT